VALNSREFAARFAWAAESQDYLERGARYDLASWARTRNLYLLR